MHCMTSYSTASATDYGRIMARHSEGLKHVQLTTKKVGCTLAAVQRMSRLGCVRKEEAHPAGPW